MSSLSQIKRSRQEETNREQRRGGKKRWREESATERCREGEQGECLCDQEDGKKKAILKSSARQVFMTGCVGLDGGGSKGAMCHRGRQRLFKACQPGNTLSHSYLVCLDRHSAKVERRLRRRRHSWHVDWMALNYSGQWRFMLPFLGCQSVRGADCYSITESFSRDDLQLSVIQFLRLSWAGSAQNSQWT